MTVLETSPTNCAGRFGKERAANLFLTGVGAGEIIALLLYDFLGKDFFGVLGVVEGSLLIEGNLMARPSVPDALAKSCERGVDCWRSTKNVLNQKWKSFP